MVGRDMVLTLDSTILCHTDRIGLCYIAAMNEHKGTDFYDTGCFPFFVHTESRAHEWEDRHARDKRGWAGGSRVE